MWRASRLVQIKGSRGRQCYGPTRCKSDNDAHDSRKVSVRAGTVALQGMSGLLPFLRRDPEPSLFLHDPIAAYCRYQEDEVGVCAAK